MTEISFEDRVKGLRGWARDQDAHVRSAVDLLIWNKSWIRRSDFADACITQRGPGLIARIDWFAADRFTAADRSSSSQRRILSLAIALAERDAPWLRFTGDAHARAVVTAIAAAMEVDIVKPAGAKLAEPERWLVEDARKALAEWDQGTGSGPGLAGRLSDVLAILDRVVPPGGDGG